MSDTVFNGTTDLPYLLIHGLILFIISYFLFTIQFSPYYGYFSSVMIFSALIIVMIIMLLGVVNVVLSETMWSMKIQSNGENWLFQGFLILIPTQILLSLTPVLLQRIVSLNLYVSFASSALLIFGYLLTFGFIGKTVASHYLEDGVKKSNLQSTSEQLDEDGTRARCMNCGSSHKYPESVISDSRTVRCYTCGKEFYISSKSELLKHLEEYSDSAIR